MTHREISKMVEVLFAIGLNENDIAYFVRAEIGRAQ
jgi:hypothetical protein